MQQAEERVGWVKEERGLRCDEKCAGGRVGLWEKDTTNRLRLGVLEEVWGFETGAEGRLTRGRAESCRAAAPDIGASIPVDMLPPPLPPPPPPVRDRWSWGLGLERSAVGDRS